MKLLGVYINNGFTGEAKIFAGLLKHRGTHYDAYVLHHDYPKDRESANRFEAASGARIERMDVGRRQGGKRSVVEKAWNIMRFRIAWLKLLRHAQEFRPDVVYSSQQYWDCLAASFIAKRLGVPQIIHLHYNIGPFLGKPILKRFLTVDHIVTVSEFIRKQVIDYGVSPERVTTLHNFLEVGPVPSDTERLAVRKTLGVTSDTPLIGMVSRLVEGKGHADTLRAFANIGEGLSASGPTPPQLHIIGDGPEQGALEQLAAELDISDRVRFLGRRSDVQQLLPGFDIFCHPSRMDPCPLTLFEAASAELPVVAYDEGGAPEIIQHGTTGLLAPPGDILALSRNLARLLNDRAEARRMGRAGYMRIAERFRPEGAGETFSALVHQIATPTPSNRLSTESVPRY